VTGVGSTEPAKSGGGGTAQPLRQPEHPGAYVQPAEPEGDVVHKNVLLGWALFALALVVAAGTVGVALIYIALSHS
jgi:hypothetical protein